MKLLSIAILVLVLWVLGWAVLKIASLFIHLLLPVAVGAVVYAGWQHYRRRPHRP